MKHSLLSTTRMTPMEAKAGRFMRAPDHTAAEGGSSSIQQLSGGVTRVTPDGNPEGQAAANAAAAGGAQQEGNQQQEPQKDPALPEGYDSWEAYGKAVAEGKATPPAKQEEGQQEQKGVEGDLSPELQAKLEPFTAEIQKDGKLSDASIKKAAAEFGVDEALVRNYADMAAQLNAQAPAQAAAQVAPFHEQTGGAEGYKAFQEWSVSGMNEAEQKALNDAYSSGNTQAALALQQQFVDRWKSEGNGPAARDVTRQGNQNQQPSGDAYESWEQVRKDMAKPEYERDPAFRKKVEDKLGRSAL